MPLTAQEQAQVRYHLGLPVLEGTASYVTGVPLVQQYTDRLTLHFTSQGPESVRIVRRILADLECLESIMRKNRQDLPLDRVEQIKFRSMGGLAELRSEYLNLVMGLADVYEIKPNPESLRLRALGYSDGCGGSSVKEVC